MGKQLNRWVAAGLGGLFLIATVLVFPVAPVFAQQQNQRPQLPVINPSNFPPRLQMNVAPPPDSPDALSPKQKSAIISSNFVKAKKDAAKLRSLAEALEKEVDETNKNLLSVRVIQNASKIEKLAKKIRNEARDY